MFMGIQESLVNQLLKIYSELCLMDHIQQPHYFLFTPHIHFCIFNSTWYFLGLFYFILSYRSFNMAALEDSRRYLCAWMSNSP